LRLDEAADRSDLRLGAAAADRPELRVRDATDRPDLRFGEVDRLDLRFGEADRLDLRFGEADRLDLRFGEADRLDLRFGEADDRLDLRVSDAAVLRLPDAGFLALRFDDDFLTRRLGVAIFIHIFVTYLFFFTLRIC
jgi:hypothetical protein